MLFFSYFFIRIIEYDSDETNERYEFDNLYFGLFHGDGEMGVSKGYNIIFNRNHYDSILKMIKNKKIKKKTALTQTIIIMYKSRAHCFILGGEGRGRHPHESWNEQIETSDDNRPRPSCIPFSPKPGTKSANPEARRIHVYASIIFWIIFKNFTRNNTYWNAWNYNGIQNINTFL